jgi:hypothetical protein
MLAACLEHEQDDTKEIYSQNGRAVDAWLPSGRGNTRDTNQFGLKILTFINILTVINILTHWYKPV